MATDPPVFTGLYLAVRDMATALAFYRRLGFDIPPDADASMHVVVNVGDGVTVAFGALALTKSYNPDWHEAAAGSTNALQFDVPTRDAVDEVFAEMTSAGYDGRLPPIDAFWGSRYAEIADPDGNVVGVHSPQDPAKAGRPPL